MIVRNAGILTLDDRDRIIECGAVEIRPDGRLGWIGNDANIPVSLLADDVIDAGGKLLMPALINCHTHLYSSLARGIPMRGPAPHNFVQILKKLWWKLDSVLDEEDIYLSALVGLIDSAKAGVGTLFDHHSSPGRCPGSLDIIERAFREVGLRGCLSYETSDRNGRASAEEAIAENIRFIEHIGTSSRDSMMGASFGLHASFTLGDRTLRDCVEAAHSLRAGFHVHVAEDRVDVEKSRKISGKSPVRRLNDIGVLGERSIAAHCVHVTRADVALLSQSGVNVVHNPQSNCNNAVGTANLTELLKAKVMLGLGSDGYSPAILNEFAAASLLQKVRSGDPRIGGSEAFTALLNNRKISRRVCGWNIGTIEADASADLMLVDYFPPTPLTPDTLFAHMLFGITHAPVDSLWVSGKPVIRNRHCVNVDEKQIFSKAALRAQKLWQRI